MVPWVSFGDTVVKVVFNKCCFLLITCLPKLSVGQVICTMLYEPAKLSLIYRTQPRTQMRSLIDTLLGSGVWEPIR